MDQRSHNLGKFPQIFAVSMGVVLGIMRILCIPFKILLFGNCSANSQPPSPSRNNDMEISCESAAMDTRTVYSKIGIYGGNPIQPYIATIVRLSACEVKPLSETRNAGKSREY